MKRLLFRGETVNSRNIDDAVRILRDGGVVIYPTDTVYALGCDALNNRAIERLCRLTGINLDKQLLSVVCASISQAAEYARIDNRAFRLMKDNLPGPFTFILPSASSLPKVFKGRKSVGVRVPDNAIALALAESLGNPVMTTSVSVENDDDIISPDALELAYRHDADLLIDAGEGGSVVSTIIDCLDSSAPEILRQGLGDIDL